MVNTKIWNIVTDYVQEEFELLPEKDVLFKNEIIKINPADMVTSLEGGYRVIMPNFEIGDESWENVITAPITANQVEATPNGTYTYNSNGLTERDEQAIKVWRRLLFEYSKFNDMIRARGESAAPEIARQLTRGAVRQMDKDFHYVLRGAIPSANHYDETSSNAGGLTAGSRYMNPEAIVAAANVIGDNMDELTILIMHSHQWTKLRQQAYSTYSDATLLTANETQRRGVWLADNKLVYVTDRCESETSGTDESTYNAYLIAPGQLQAVFHEPFNLTIGDESPLHESVYMRGNMGYVAHLKGVEWKPTAPNKPTCGQLGDRNNWQLGRYDDEKQVLAVQITTN